jgi:hypothetical protein
MAIPDEEPIFSIPTKGTITGVGGRLHLHAEPDANGTDSFTITAADDFGGTAMRTVNVTIAPINDAPTFTKGADQVLLEDAGAQSVPGWATAIAAGPANEAAQGLAFIITTDNPELFSVPPAIAADGTLTYTPAPDAFGNTTVHVRLQDDGGTDHGGVDMTPEQTFSVAISGINEAPIFTKGPDQAVLEDAGPQTVAGWATTIATGPPNEVGQTLEFIVETDNAALSRRHPRSPRMAR